jgi:hypothetical protein
VSVRGCFAEEYNCVCSSSANFSTCVMDPVVPNEKYVFERSCCAEENDCVSSSCAKTQYMCTDPVVPYE